MPNKYRIGRSENHIAWYEVVADDEKSAKKLVESGINGLDGLEMVELEYVDGDEPDKWSVELIEGIEKPKATGPDPSNGLNE